MQTVKKTFADCERFARMVAEKQNWELSQDGEFRDSLLEGLNTNWNRYGYFLCPCRDTDGTRELDADIICPCAVARADIAEYGHCYCALFFRNGVDQKANPPASIPDRARP